jgi:hypothetical protein
MPQLCALAIMTSKFETSAFDRRGVGSCYSSVENERLCLMYLVMDERYEFGDVNAAIDGEKSRYLRMRINASRRADRQDRVRDPRATGNLDKTSRLDEGHRRRSGSDRL